MRRLQQIIVGFLVEISQWLDSLGNDSFERDRQALVDLIINVLMHELEEQGMRDRWLKIGARIPVQMLDVVETVFVAVRETSYPGRGWENCPSFWTIASPLKGNTLLFGHEMRAHEVDGTVLMDDIIIALATLDVGSRRRPPRLMEAYALLQGQAYAGESQPA